MSVFDVASSPPRAARPAAFRRPGLILAYAAYLLAAGFALAAPWSALLHRTAAEYPRGDAELFDQGGVMLMEAIRRALLGLPAAATSSGVVLLFAGAVGLLPFGMLIAGLGRQGRVRAPFLAARAVGSLGTLTLIWGLGFAAQAILGALLALLGVKLVGALHLAPRGEALAHASLRVLALVPPLPLGVARDLAMFSAVNDATRLYTSASRALLVLRRAFGRALGAYLARALLALAVLLAAFWIPTSLLAPTSPPRVAIPFLVHQLAIVLAVALRASWLAAAIRFLDARAPLAVPEAPFAEPEGMVASPEGTFASPEGTFASPDGTFASPDGTFASPDGTFASSEGTFAEPNGTLSPAESAFAEPDGTDAPPTKSS